MGRHPDSNRDKTVVTVAARAMLRRLYRVSVSPCKSTTAPTGATVGSST